MPQKCVGAWVGTPLGEPTALPQTPSWIWGGGKGGRERDGRAREGSEGNRRGGRDRDKEGRKGVCGEAREIRMTRGGGGGREGRKEWEWGKGKGRGISCIRVLPIWELCSSRRRLMFCFVISATLSDNRSLQYWCALFTVVGSKTVKWGVQLTCGWSPTDASCCCFWSLWQVRLFDNVIAKHVEFHLTSVLSRSGKIRIGPYMCMYGPIFNTQRNATKLCANFETFVLTLPTVISSPIILYFLSDFSYVRAYKLTTCGRLLLNFLILSSRYALITSR